MGWFSDFMAWLRPPAIKPVVLRDIIYKTRNLSDLNDLEVVAATIWGEARGEGVKGMTAVACVIQNRADIGGWFGNSPREVCLKPFQFSCWNKDNPNRTQMLAVTQADSDYRIATSIANSVLTSSLSDITDGADSYEVRGTGAYWAKGLTPVASIGKHDFYKTRG